LGKASNQFGKEQEFGARGIGEIKKINICQVHQETLHAEQDRILARSTYKLAKVLIINLCRILLENCR
jgi:hypothetical protein